MHNGGNCVVVHYDVNWPILYKHLPIQITLHLLVMEWVPNIWFSGNRNQPYHYKTFKKYQICMAIIWKKIETISCSFFIPPMYFSPTVFAITTYLHLRDMTAEKFAKSTPKMAVIFLKFQRKYLNLWNRMHFIIKTISVGYYL